MVVRQSRLEAASDRAEAGETTKHRGLPGEEATISRRALLKYGAMGTAGIALGIRGDRLGGLGRNEPRATALSPRRSFSTHSPVTLTAWVWTQANLLEQQFNAVKRAYPKELGHVELQASIAAPGDTQLAEKVALALTGHTQLPDFLTLQGESLPQFAAKPGVLKNVTAAFGPVKKDLYTGVKAMCRFNGEYVAFPYELKGKLFYYRRDLFESAGIDPRTIPDLTEEEFFAAGKQFTRKHPGRFIMDIAEQPWHDLFCNLLSAYAPIGFVNRAGKYDVTTNPAFRQSLEFIRKLRTSGICYPIDFFSTNWPTAIKDGKINGLLIGSWMDTFLPSYAGLSGYNKWRATLWPKLSPLADQKYGSDPGGGAVLVIPSSGPNASLVADLLSMWMLTDKGGLAAFGVNGILPNLISAGKSVVDQLESAKKPKKMSELDWKELPQNYFGGVEYIKTKLATQNTATTFSFSPQAGIAYDTIANEWVQKAAQGKVGIGAALAGMESDMKKEIGNPWSSAS